MASASPCGARPHTGGGRLRGAPPPGVTAGCPCCHPPGVAAGGVRAGPPQARACIRSPMIQNLDMNEARPMRHYPPSSSSFPREHRSPPRHGSAAGRPGPVRGRRHGRCGGGAAADGGRSRSELQECGALARPLQAPIPDSEHVGWLARPLGFILPLSRSADSFLLRRFLSPSPPLPLLPFAGRRGRRHPSTSCAPTPLYIASQNGHVAVVWSGWWRLGPMSRRR